MAWITPPTFNSGDTLAASDLNILGDDLLYLKAITDGVTFSGVQLRRAATQAIATSNDEYISWDTENFDYGSWWTSGTGIDVPAGAIPSGFTSIAVLVFGSVKFATDGTGARKMTFHKNGTGFGNWRVSALSDDNTSVYLSEVTTVVSGDVLKMQVWQNSGGSLNVSEARMTVLRFAPVA